MGGVKESEKKKRKKKNIRETYPLLFEINFRV